MINIAKFNEDNFNDDFERYTDRVEREVEKRSIKSIKKQSRISAKNEEIRQSRLVKQQNKLARNESKQIKKAEKQLIKAQKEKQHVESVADNLNKIAKYQRREARKRTSFLSKLKPVFQRADDFYYKAISELKHSKKNQERLVDISRSEIIDITHDFELRLQLNAAKARITELEAENQRLREFAADKETQVERVSFEDMLRLEEQAIEQQKIIDAQELELQAQERELQRLQDIELQKEQIREEETIEKLRQELEDKRLELEEREAILREESRRIRRGGQNTNPDGRGGIPGINPNSQGQTVEGSIFSRDVIPLDDGVNLRWNSDIGEYDFEINRDINPTSKEPLNFTFFAAEMSYPKEGYNVSHALYSQTVLRRQVWYDRPIKGKNNDDELAQMGFALNGKVPLDAIIEKLNDYGGIYVSVVQTDIRVAPPRADFRHAYKNWRYLYEQGKFYKNSKDELYAVVYYRDEKSQGNPPTQRTAGKDYEKKKISKGDLIRVGYEERMRWNKARTLS